MLRKTNLAWTLPVVFFLASVSVASAGEFDRTTRYDASDAANWSGLYVGLHAGYGWNDVDSDYDFGSANNLLIDRAGLSSGLQNSLDGYIVGGQIGFQRQFGRWVLGVEGMASATGMDSSSSAAWSFDNIRCAFGLCAGAAGEGKQSLDARLDNLYTATGRLGYTYENWLAYVKGGYATADIDVRSSISGDITGCILVCATVPVSATGTSDKRHDGWMIGGGIERMIAPNLTLGVEYTYIDLSARTHSIDGPLDVGSFASVPGGYKLRVDPDAVQTVALRLNFLLNGPHRPVNASLK
jgi:outer membrane immunogenic protein